MSLMKPILLKPNDSQEKREVCFTHHKKVCFTCGVDFSEISGEKENETDEEDRVSVLNGVTARFMPQWDEQVRGPGNILKLKQDYKNPPPPLFLSDIRTYYCSACHLTWLGEAAASHHPQHHTIANVFAPTKRSLLVFTSFACYFNESVINPRGGLGVYFGPESKFNLSKLFVQPGVNVYGRAELASVTCALETVRLKVLPERQEMVEVEEGNHSPNQVRDVAHLRLIIATSSKYLVETMCKHSSSWKKDDQGVLLDVNEIPVDNCKEILELKDEVEKLSMKGVQVAYYYVRSEENREAYGLAEKERMRGGLSVISENVEMGTTG